MPRSDPFSVRVPATNRLIAALPSKDRARLLADCEEVHLEVPETLVAPDARIRHVYFPVDGSYISLLIPGRWRVESRSRVGWQRRAVRCVSRTGDRSGRRFVPWCREAGRPCA